MVVGVGVVAMATKGKKNLFLFIFRIFPPCSFGGSSRPSLLGDGGPRGGPLGGLGGHTTHTPLMTSTTTALLTAVSVWGERERERGGERERDREIGGVSGCVMGVAPE